MSPRQIRQLVALVFAMAAGCYCMYMQHRWVVATERAAQAMERLNGR